MYDFYLYPEFQLTVKCVIDNITIEIKNTQCILSLDVIHTQVLKCRTENKKTVHFDWDIFFFLYITIGIVYTLNNYFTSGHQSKGFDSILQKQNSKLYPLVYFLIHTAQMNKTVSLKTHNFVIYSNNFICLIYRKYLNSKPIRNMNYTI